MKNLFERYSRFLVDHQLVIVGIALLIITGSLVSARNLETTAPEYRDMIPEDIESVEALDFASDEFGTSGSSVNVLVEIDPSKIDSRESRDIRSPEVIEYVSILQQKIEAHEKVKSTSSIVSRVENNGRIPDERQIIVEKLENTSKIDKDSVNSREVLGRTVTGLQSLRDSLEKQRQAAENLHSGVQEGSESIEKLNHNLEQLEARVSGIEIRSDLGGIEEGLETSRRLQEKTGKQQLGFYKLYIDEFKNPETATSHPEIYREIADTGSLHELNSTFSKYSVQYDLLADRGWMTEKTFIGNVSQSHLLINGSITATGKSREGVEKTEESLSQLSAGIDETSRGLEKLHSGYHRVYLGLNRTGSGLEDLTLAQERTVNGTVELKNRMEKAERYMMIFGENPYENRNDRENRDIYMDDQYSMTVIRVQVRDMDQAGKKQFAREIKTVLDNTDKPSNVKVSAAGDPFVFRELEEETVPTLHRTSALSTLVVFTLIILFFTSLRYGLTAFMTIVIGEIVTVGLISALNIPISSEMSGAVSMIMAVGDDFGIQVTNRFRQELRDRKTEEALVETLSNVMVPMTITTVGTLIGFRAFSLGQMKFLATLGNMLSIGIVSCFITSITIIPVILLIGEKKFGDKWVDVM